MKSEEDIRTLIRRIKIGIAGKEVVDIDETEDEDFIREYLAAQESKIEILQWVLEE